MSSLRQTLLLFSALSFAASSPTVKAGDPAGGKLVLNDEAPALVKLTWDSRLRYEYADQDGLDESNAFTLRNRIGLLSREINGFAAFAEYEGTLAADRDGYRAASVHGPATRTVIADPESHELNQAWISYRSAYDDLLVKAGRQRITLDNHRYIGNVGWRQNEQTFDAATFTWNVSEKIELFYGYVWRVNRIFGSEVFSAPQLDFKGNSHLFNVTFKDLPLGTFTGYVYSLDLHNPAGDINSNTSIGGILSGPISDSGWDYYLELATQFDSYDNPADYHAFYAHANLSKALVKNVTGTLGAEYLGSNKGVGYNFPLGTNHRFNGFADMFTSTPAGGLTDLYYTLATTLDCGVKLASTYHYFDDDSFSTGLGHELDFVASKDLGGGVSVLGKAARFWGQNGLPDTTRLSIELDYQF